MMSILVAYASRYGSTKGIADRIADVLRAKGHQVEVLPVETVEDPSRYDAVVLGSAAYLGAWMKSATRFARRNEAVLSARPLWLFSSGPLGHATEDSEGRNLREVSEPRQFAKLEETLRPRGKRVFYGALAPKRLNAFHKLLRRLPAGQTLLPEGDFRDWKDVEAWAEAIASELGPTVSREG